MELITRVFDALGVTELMGGPEGLLRGLHAAQAELLRVGLDVQTAKSKQRRLSEAVLDFDNYPFLAKMHVGLDELLRWTLPPAIAEWARRFLTEPPLPVVDEFRTYLVEMAAADPNPVRRALCEWALFEGVRLNLTIRVYLYPEETSMVGLDGEAVSRIAEQTVTTWLQPPAPSLDGIRPFHVIIGAALTSLQDHAEELRQAMMLVQRDFRDQIERQARLDQALGEMDAADAILIRNDLARRLDEQPLSVELLQKRHPYILGDGSRNALDQRVSRTRKKILRGGVPAARRTKPALIDIIKEVNNTSDTKRRN